MTARVLDGLDAVRAAVGQELGSSEWVTVDAAAVARFGRATGAGTMVDDGGGTIPPLLVLSLTNLFLPQIVEVRGVTAGVNYGTGQVRFPVAVPVGARLRGHAALTAVEDVSGGVQTTMRIRVEVEGETEPACVVDALSRWLA